MVVIHPRVCNLLSLSIWEEMIVRRVNYIAVS